MPTNKIIKTKAVVSNHIFAIRCQDVDFKQNSLHSSTSFKKGEVICNFTAGVTQSYATYLTVQVGISKHITLQPEFLQYINHSCVPTVFFDTTAMQLIALQDLIKGDELTFFYPSTEWDMAQPFVCNCGSRQCLGIIQGAKYLSPQQALAYRLNVYIEGKRNHEG